MALIQAAGTGGLSEENNAAVVRSEWREQLERNPLVEKPRKLSPVEEQRKRVTDSYADAYFAERARKDKEQVARIQEQQAREKAARETERRRIAELKAEQERKRTLANMQFNESGLDVLYKSHGLSSDEISKINNRMSARRCFGDLERHTYEVLKLKADKAERN